MDKILICMLIMNKMRQHLQCGSLDRPGPIHLPVSPLALPRYGGLHMVANEAVLNMLNEIGHKKNIPEYIEKARDRDDPFRLFGFGHRVYKNFDPRAKVCAKPVMKCLVN